MAAEPEVFLGRVEGGREGGERKQQYIILNLTNTGYVRNDHTLNGLSRMAKNIENMYGANWKEKTTFGLPGEDSSHENLDEGLAETLLELGPNERVLLEIEIKRVIKNTPKLGDHLQI